jgi:ABC-2 type transport system permease protein
MTFFSDSWHLFGRLVRGSVRMPVWLIMSMVQPIIWMALFGQLFRSVATLPGFGGGSYIQFLAPGIVMMSVLFGSAWAGMGMIFDINFGVMDRLLATPVSRGAFIAARVGISGATACVQGLVILAMAVVLGARPGGGLSGLLLVLVAAALLAAAFGAASNGIALLTRRPETLAAVMNFTVLPMTFTSSMIMARDLMPGWIRTVSTFNPVNWAVTVARAGFQGGHLSQVPLPLVLLTGFAMACGYLATRAFEVYRRSL